MALTYWRLIKRIKWEMVWARSFDHLVGQTDHDEPAVPILTQVEARISLIIRTGWVAAHMITCLAVVAGVIHHW